MLFETGLFNHDFRIQQRVFKEKPVDRLFLLDYLLISKVVVKEASCRAQLTWIAVNQQDIGALSQEQGLPGLLMSGVIQYTQAAQTIIITVVYTAVITHCNNDMATLHVLIRQA